MFSVEQRFTAASSVSEPELPNSNFDRDTYYYNVATWLDGPLYAPESLEGFFARQLERTATGKPG
jgi:hypothetical protein